MDLSTSLKFLGWFWEHWDALMLALHASMKVAQDGSQTATDATAAVTAIKGIFETAKDHTAKVLSGNPPSAAEDQAAYDAAVAAFNQYGPDRTEGQQDDGA